MYRRYIDFSVIQALREMKGKIEREVRRRGLKDNIKLGAGGIREIEFIVQVFQLIRGGREIKLQQYELLKLLPEIRDLGLITPQQYRELREAYIFYDVLKTCFKPLMTNKRNYFQQMKKIALD